MGRCADGHRWWVTGICTFTHLLICTFENLPIDFQVVDLEEGDVAKLADEVALGETDAVGASALPAATAGGLVVGEDVACGELP